jgi:hypothetical protein
MEYDTTQNEQQFISQQVVYIYLIFLNKSLNHLL